MNFDLGKIARVHVVHVELGENANRFHFLTLRKTKGEIVILKKGEGFLHLEDALKAMKANHPILLHFSGKGILNRKTSHHENYRHSILLNGNSDNFYFSDYFEQGEVFSSVIRKDVVEEVIQNLEEKKRIVISFSSGPFFASILNKVLDKSQLTVDGHTLQFQKQKLVDFTKLADPHANLTETVVLGDERVNIRLMSCAAIGAALFNPTDQLVFPSLDKIFVQNYEEAKQKNIFIRFGTAVMLFFLVLLFGNYMYVGYLNAQVSENAIFLTEFDETLTQIVDLEEEKDRKEKLLQSSGLLNKNFLSYYLMELGNSIPTTISFDQIIVRPLTDEIKQRKKIAFEEHLILINGRTTSSHVLSRWIQELEEKPWLEKVDILSYEYANSQGIFELEMMVF
ncbi:MAG: hypothetical protein IT222_04580 [Crocinitomix sp.]|nr:hypothetical protein [Crocinitomix sp.]